MFTYNELRGLLVAGEFVAAMAILIASRTVGTALNGAAVYVVIEDREYTISQTSDGLSIYLIITENSDGTFAVDEDVYGWEEAEVVGMVDENTGKNGAPPVGGWQAEFEEAMQEYDMSAVSPEYQEYLLDLLESQGVDVASLTEEEINQITIRFQSN